MTGFFIKKAFFDGWDNLFALVAFNAGYLLLALVFIVVPPVLGAGDALSLIALCLGVLALGVWHSLTAYAVDGIADYKSTGFQEFFSRIGEAWKPGIAFGLLCLLVIFSFMVGIPFYLGMKSFIGLFLASLLFWVNLTLVLASQYFLPLAARRGGSLRRNARVAFTLLLDNLGFSFFLLLYNTVTLVLSVALAFLAPGFAGLALASADAVKLRLKKYNWLEGKDPSMRKQRVPWVELLEEEKDLVGERTLKGMIFPWKEGK
ncbi:MAG: hypothetical protein NT061_08670 [Spirochaetes bacterium]|nr:hypothetical protein [Spirochaetota bacterium]